MADKDRMREGSVLGDINPEPIGHKHQHDDESSMADREQREEQDPHAMHGGSQHGRSKHPGSRDVTEGPTGGTGTEVGGTRNYRQGTGATGMDIGNRPE